MDSFAMFEACGLYFILRRTGRGTESVFQLCDEAFSSAPVVIRARSYKALFDAVEKNIGLAVPRHARAAIRLKLGALGRPSRTLARTALRVTAPSQPDQMKAVGA